MFCLVEGTKLNDYQDEQDNAANRPETRLRAHSVLMKGRKLLAEPTVITFAPAANRNDKGSIDYPLCNAENLQETIDQITWNNPEQFESAISVLQLVSTVRRSRRARQAIIPNSRGTILKGLEDSIANLDSRQSKAVIETVDGVQRIRGLAGSGKTIVLALKAAYLHTQHPEWNIAVTFNTRSLKSQFRRLINTFVIEQSGEEPDWFKLSVLNAWGAPGGSERNGMYFHFAKLHEPPFYDFKTARDKFGFSNAFHSVCAEALSRKSEKKHAYDVILIDEAQDFTPEFLRLCYSMLRGNKRLVYAYDEMQSLTDSTFPSPGEIFGVKEDGTPKVVFSDPQEGQPQQDIILHKCYRNSRPVLATAHALGFGVYRDTDAKTGTGLVQMFDQPKLWLDVGYTVRNGELAEGQRVCLERTPETSPLFLESHSEISDLIQFEKFNNKSDQAEWIAQAIKKNLTDDELQPDDIIVINPDPLTTRSEVGLVRRKLFEFGIQTHLVGVDYSPDLFFDSGNASVAFTGIFRAKGNEAGMVYIMNADDCARPRSLARARNQLFTAITRSKAWVRVLGVGSDMVRLVREYERVRSANFSLDFTYPTLDQRQTLKIINREHSTPERRVRNAAAEDLSRFVKRLESGSLKVEDIPEDILERLRLIMGEGAGDA